MNADNGCSTFFFLYVSNERRRKKEKKISVTDWACKERAALGRRQVCWCIEENVCALTRMPDIQIPKPVCFDLSIYLYQKDSASFNFFFLFLSADRQFLITSPSFLSLNRTRRVTTKQKRKEKKNVSKRSGTNCHYFHANTGEKQMSSRNAPEAEQ